MRTLCSPRPQPKISDAQRWQKWIDKVFRQSRPQLPRRFIPLSRCVAEQNLRDAFVMIDASGTVYDGQRIVGIVSESVMKRA